LLLEFETQRKFMVKSDMTTLISYLSRLFLILVFIAAFSLTSAIAQPGGHLVVLRPANFGWNLAFKLEIDGRPVGSVVQGRQFHTWLPAGEHVLTVSKVPYTGYAGPTSTKVNVQPGLTYVYTATWDSAFVFLRPSGLCLTPGALWQDGWPARPSCAWQID
jgi:hypothetical protein